MLVILMIFGKDKKAEKTGLPPIRRNNPQDIPPPPNISSPAISANPQRQTRMPAENITLPPLPDDLKDPLFEEKEEPPLMTPPQIPRMNERFSPGPDFIETRKNPTLQPTQKETLKKLSQVKGPVFISLDRYKEVKSILNSMRDNSRELREVTESFKENKKDGVDLLAKSVNKLENIEEEIENINATLRI